MNHTEVEHDGQTYPAGAVCRGKLLIWETKQFVCITSMNKIKFMYVIQYEFISESFKET